MLKALIYAESRLENLACTNQDQDLIDTINRVLKKAKGL